MKTFDDFNNWKTPTFSSSLVLSTARNRMSPEIFHRMTTKMKNVIQGTEVWGNSKFNLISKSYMPFYCKVILCTYKVLGQHLSSAFLGERMNTKTSVIC